MRRMRLEELVDLGLVDARERARRQRREQARGGAGRRLRGIRPPVGQGARRTTTAALVGAARHRAVRGLASAEPLHVLERHADRHRVLALLGLLFAAPWTDAPPDELRCNFVQYQWAQRASFRTDRWSVIFTVLRDGRPIGVQDMRATDFATRRTIESGSWLTRAEQGHGLGMEMRAALLSFAFDHLGAEVAESGAMTWNAASLGVSRRLGYRENGLTRVVGRPGVVGEELRGRLARDEFMRPDWTLLVDGAEPARTQLLGTLDGGRREG